MKIDAKKLLGFLNCATINGKVEGAILRFIPEGLKISVKSTDNISAASGIMKKEVFLDYELVEYPIKDIPKFIKLLDLFPGLIELKRQDNMLILSGNIDEKHVKKVSYVLASPEFIENELKGELPSKFDNGFVANKKVFTDALKSYTIIKASCVHFVVKDNVFNLVVGEDKFDHITESIQVEYKNSNTKVGSVFADIVSILSDKVSLAFNDSYPILFSIKTEEYDVKLVVAPLVEND